MPVTLVDRLPLPNLKVYSAGSVVLLSVAVYYAIVVTSDPSWRANTTLVQREASVPPEKDTEPVSVSPPVLAVSNSTRNLTEQFVVVMTFMMHEPLCMWSLINIAYCTLAVFGLMIQRAVFGPLRVAEAQRVKDKFWNYVFYKFIFVFGVVNVQYMDEVLLWCCWFTLVGFLHLLGQLCKDRFEYLSSSPTTAPWAHVRLAMLLGGILLAGGALLGVATVFGLPLGRDTFAFMAAECVLVLVCALHVCVRYALQLREADVAGPTLYYTHLVFDSVSLVVELVHVVHMVVYSNMLVSMASLVLLMQLRHLLHELQARLQRHKLYTERATHITRHCPMASREEVEKNQDNCAICWEPMKEARKLPCAHLFHNSCLCQWVQQDASCPTCRRALAPAPPSPPGAAGAAPRPRPRGPIMRPPLGMPLRPTDVPHVRHQRARAPPPPPNHLFHFDGKAEDGRDLLQQENSHRKQRSRYVSWLPSFSVEVTRVRAPPPAQIDAMARQVQQLFPQFPLSVLAADLTVSRSADVTLDNILEGRLLPPPYTPEPDPEPQSAPQTHQQSQSVETNALLIENMAPESRTPEASMPRQAPSALHYIADTSTQTHTHNNIVGVNFPQSAMERELTLQRRKEQLIASARARYLARRPTLSAPHSAPLSAPHSATLSAPDSHS